MKKLLLVITSLALLFTFSACGDDEKSEAPTGALTEEVTITFWHGFTGAIEEELVRLTDEFNESNKLVTVELVYQGSYNDLETKLLASQESGDLPTMSLAYSTWDGLRDSFAVLNDYTKIEGSELKWDDFVKSFVDEVTTEDGDIYGVPFNKSTEVLYYNKDILAEAGVTTVPSSYEELFEISKTIYDETGVTGVGFDSLSGYLASSLTANDLAWYNSKDSKYNFTNDAVVSNIDLYKNAIEAGYARTAGEDTYLSGPFGSERVAMYVGSTAGKMFVDSAVDGKFEWGAMPYPNSTAVQQGTNVVIYDSATDNEKLGAWEFINFLTTDKNVTDFAIATGYIPTKPAAADSDDFKAYMANDEVATAANEQTEKMTAGEPTKSGSGQIYREFQVTMTAILDTDKDTLTGLEELEALAEQIVSRGN